MIKITQSKVNSTLSMLLCIMKGVGKERIHTSVRNVADYMKRSRSQWPRGLRRSSVAARLLGLWVRIPSREWMFVCCVCLVLSGRGLGEELISRPDDSYRLWCVVMSDLATSRLRRLQPALGRSATGRRKNRNRIINADNN
jgi:hypothetical protein